MPRHIEKNHAGHVIRDEIIPDPPNPLIYPFDFVARFTDAELAAIQLSADPNVIRGRTMVQTITTFVDVSDPQTIGFVNYLAAVGLIPAERVPLLLAYG